MSVQEKPQQSRRNGIEALGKGPQPRETFCRMLPWKVHGLVERFGGTDLGPDTVSAKVFDSQASVLPGQGYHEGVCVILAPCQFRRSHSNL